jgi:Sec-independent protein translocase protein TatA
MDILGIGPLELIFILSIALIVLGPSDMVKAGRTVGRFLRQVITSSTWRAVTRTSDELRTLPNKLIREAGLDEDFKQIEAATKEAVPPNLNSDLSKWQEDIDTWTSPPTIGKQPPEAESPLIDTETVSEDQTEEDQS